jgi:Na+-transporting NADH:ubiquinone oxidoreductase subunit B
MTTSIKIRPHLDDLFRVLALTPPLVWRLYSDGTASAAQRLILLLFALAIAYGWATLFARRAQRPLGPGLPPFAIIFVLLLPGPVGWATSFLALSFGAVFSREIFGGRAILPPALIGLAFAIFSFPEGGFETRGVLATATDPVFAASCLPGLAILLARGSLPWQIITGAVAGASAAAVLTGSLAWWEHLMLGAFIPGILFLAAAPEGSVAGSAAKWAQGILVGGLIVMIRTANPDQPDGVVFAVLLGGLFVPLLDRAFSWRPRRG